jgi:hypothetical protein
MSYQNAAGPALIIRHTGQVFALGKDPITIGRTSDNDIILSDPEVSRKHATIYWQDGIYYIGDLGSANGTYVDERRIAEAVRLRQGSAIRLGNTVMDVDLTAALDHGTYGSLPDYDLEMDERPRSRAPVIIGLLVGGIVVVGLVLGGILLLSGGGRARPVVTIQSPAAGSQITADTEVILQVTATGARNITRIEISVDGTLVGLATSPDALGQASLTTTQPWTFGQTGSHVVSAVAYTAQGRASDPVSANVAVVGAIAQQTPTLTPETPTTVTPSTTPLPTVAPPTPLPSDTPAPEVPTDTPTPTPTDSPTPSSTPTDTPTPTPTATNQPPEISFFRASPDAIVSGECTTLEWGAVNHATEASIDQGIGGIGTPGSQNVCPAETTTYVLTATGPGGTSTASATVTVSAPQPDLVVQAIAFVPDPPVQGQNNEVRIALQNQGTMAAGPFGWEWQPGTAAPLTGSLPGLNPGETVVVTAIWHPNSPYANLPTVARVDTGNTVSESNEGNNELAANTEVVAPSETTLSESSEAALDGYVIGSQGAYPAQDIRVGNFGSGAGEAVYRGFLSFDLSAIPAGATIQAIQLRFYQQEIVGDPYGKLSQLLLVHVDYGPSLDLADFDAPALDPSAWLTTVSSAGDWYAITSDTIATWIAEDLDAGRTRLQMRLQFNPETDDGTTADYIRVESANNTLGSNNVPQLAITYTP